MAGMALAGLDQAGIALPAATRQRLVAMATADMRQTVRLIGEAATIQRLFGAAGIGMRVLKGPPLAILVYGELAVRQCRDLDLLVDPAHLSAAYRVLLAAGYRPAEPAALLTDAALRLWVWLRKDIALRSPRGGTLIELHDRPITNPHVARHAIGAADVGPVALGPDLTVEALTGDALVLYLCLHGAHHGWTRLKWLADVAALLDAYAAADLVRLHARARRERVDLEVGQALLLCRRLFDTPLPPALEASLRRSRRLAMIVRCALAFLADPRELDASRFGTTRLSLYSCLLGRSPGHFGYQMLQVSCDFRIAAALGGSRGALALSIAARPFAWVWRKASGRGVTPVRRPLADWRLVGEAFVALLVARVRLQVRPFAAIDRHLRRPLPAGRAAPSPADAAVTAVAWAIGVCVRRGPIRFLCFAQAIAARDMLRRRGVPVAIHYGVCREPDGAVATHAWAMSAAGPVVGAGNAAGFTLLHIFAADAGLA